MASRLSCFHPRQLRPHALGAAMALAVLSLSLGCDADDAAPGEAAPESGSTGPDASSNGDSLYTTGISASAGDAESDDGSETAAPDPGDTDPEPPGDTEPGPACDDQTPCPDDDGNLCTVPRCDDGVCVEEALDCDRDSNVCADATCDRDSGSCVYTPLHSNCGARDVCSTPQCEVSLDADGALLEAACVVAFNDDRGCDDGDPCTSSDTCSAGACEGTTLACDSPPTPTCNGAMLQSFGAGSCDSGTCEYMATALNCPDGCDAGACNGPAHPLISEVLYDDEGTDDNVWIELWAPPGSSLDGIVVEFVNGSSGLVGDTYPLSGTTPSDGIVLIISDAANDPALLNAADFTDAIADLQNGPDNVRLRSGETILDALGYGSFGDDETFAGEGASTPDVSPDRSLARTLSVIDTDNNASDFNAETAPSPGAINP